MSEVKIIRPQPGFQEKFCRTNVDFCIGGGVQGGGKLLSMEELVLTPKGWVRNGDLKVGDYVSTPFGKPARITAVFDHKDKDIYKLTTSDGRSCECGLEHLWAIRTNKQRGKFLKEKDPSKYLTILETKDLIDRLEKGKKSYIQIPYAQEFEEKELTIPPYVLGVMLGDGCLTPKSWQQPTFFTISNSEQDVLDKVAELSKAERVYHHPSCYCKQFYTKEAARYREYCEKVGLMTYSHEKYIPKEYLDGSIEQRKQLLYGLMDTDGSVDVHGCFSFCTTSPKLKDDFVYLCRSLGYQAKVKIDKRDKYKSGCGYNIAVLTSDSIFTSKKHLEKYNKWLSRPKRYVREGKHVYVKSIEKIGVSDARCILIDDPLHLYITRDFITTHNTYASVLACAQYVHDPLFRALYLRNNLGDLRAGGGVADTFREIFGDSIKIVESGEPHINFPSGAVIDLTHVANQNKEAIKQRFKGRQYDLIVFDEGTGYTWECLTQIFTRNRGKSQWTGHVLMTTNPEKDHWIRTFIDWYIGEDGFIREDRAGVVRYFYVNGETVNDVVWGDSKEEVLNKCRVGISERLADMNKHKKMFVWQDLVKSFTFYLGSMSENVAMLSGNAGYAASVAMVGGREAKLYTGNWNVSTKGDLNSPIPQARAEAVFDNDPMTNGDMWITADLADTGTDNTIILVWDGFHVVDMVVASVSTPRKNADMVKDLCLKYRIPETNVIFDATSGIYFKDYLPCSLAYYSNAAPMGVYKHKYMKLKDECYGRLCAVMEKGRLSFSEDLANKTYNHARLTEKITIKEEFKEECSCVKFKDDVGIRKSLITKREMRKLMGKFRSPDLLDPCAMRMMPVLIYSNGEELEKTASYVRENDYDEDGVYVNVHDDSTWC